MKYRKFYLILLTSILIYSCKNSGKENDTAKNDLFNLNQKEIAEGFDLLENNCFSCHSPNASIENQIAPSMKDIKEHYVDGDISNKQFTNDLLAFLKDPSEETSKMPSAIERYNLMPKMNFSEEQISKLASYIYYTELEKPDWFEKHYQEEKLKHHSTTSLSPIEVGQNMAMKTKGVLGKNLLKAINSKGTENALSFCSNRALPLTDSMAVSLNAQIKRVSDKNRNPKNKADQDELAYIESTKKRLLKGEEPKPQIMTVDSKQLAYYPIMTGKMCMQCHGQVHTEVLPATLSKINSLYPDDKAIGYKLNELRGIWVVKMNAKVNAQQQ